MLPFWCTRERGWFQDNIVRLSGKPKDFPPFSILIYCFVNLRWQFLEAKRLNGCFECVTRVILSILQFPLAILADRCREGRAKNKNDAVLLTGSQIRKGPFPKLYPWQAIIVIFINFLQESHLHSSHQKCKLFLIKYPHHYNILSFQLLTICKFFKFLISCGRYSKSLSPKYKARNVSKIYKKNQIAYK